MSTLGNVVRLLSGALANAAETWGDPEFLRSFFRDIGWSLSSVPGPIAALGAPANALATVWNAVRYDDVAPAQIGQLASALQGLWTALLSVESMPDPPEVAGAAFGRDLARTIVDYWLIDTMTREAHFALPLLELLGIVEIRYVAEALPRRAYTLRRIAWDRVPALLTDPGAGFRQRFGWGSDGFAAGEVLAKIRGLLGALRWSAPLREMPPEELAIAGAPSSGLVLGVDLQLLRRSEEAGVVEAGVRFMPIAPPGTHPGLALVPYLSPGLGVAFPLDHVASVKVDATFDLQGGIVLSWLPDRGLALTTDLGRGGVARTTGHATVTLAIDDPDKPEKTLIDAVGVTLVARTAQGVARIALDPAPVFGIEVELKDGILRWDSSQAPGGLGQLFGGRSFEVPAAVAIGWDSARGFYWRGGDAREATLPAALALGPVQISAARVAAEPVSGGGALILGLDGTLTVGPAVLGWQRFGVRLAVSRGSSAPIDLSVDASVPDLLALSISAPAVSGGGLLSWDSAAGRYAGALHVKIADAIDLAAWGVLQTGSATRHWSLAVILAGHIPPIELGWNFRLTGLGGLIALHRRMDTDALRDAAYGIRGGLDDLLFPDNPETRLPQLLDPIERFFPPAADSYVAGPMAEIEWGRGVQINARIRAVLLLQLDDQKIALYGTVRIGFPTIDSDSTLRVRAGLEALVDPRDKLARFSITLIEAKLFQSIQVTGGAAFFVRWGSPREFAYTIGGFHPAYRPYIPTGLKEPPRTGVHWNPISAVRLDLTQYFAITSTSMQYGASAHVVLGPSWGKLTGELAFDLLVMTSPALHFEADLHARVSVEIFGYDVASVGLDAALAGPSPWVLSGKVSARLCYFIHVTKSFHFEWGESISIPATPQSAGQLLAAELQSAGNWTSFRTRVLPVKLRHGVSAPLAPRDEIEVRQSRLPLGIRIERNEGNPLSDPGVWTLTCSSASGIVKLADVTEVFPERRFLAQPSKERPFRGGLACGARLARPDWDISAVAIAVDSTATDDLVLDGGTTVAGAVALPALPRPALTTGVASALPATSRARAFTRGAALERVK